MKCIYNFSIALGFSILLFTSCTTDAEMVPVEEQVGALPEFVIDPEDNPTTTEKVNLGRQLFWDPILSGNRDMACVTCHHPSKGYTDQRDLGLGIGGQGLGPDRVGGEVIKRNSPTIVNTAFNGIDENENYDPSNTVMFWDNRSHSLEDQALHPIRDFKEMRGNAYSRDVAIDSVSLRLANIPEYVSMFNAAFGETTVIDGDKIGKALAAFQRTIIGNNSRFDQYARGDGGALNAQEVRGLNAFIEARCNVCHSGPMFSDWELHDLGVPENENSVESDNGVDGGFRTPTLRNLPETGPYMHNGTMTTLADAVNFYEDMEVNDDDAAQLEFENDAETVAAIVAFLRTLNDENIDRTIPTSVPSGLPAGGNIQ